MYQETRCRIAFDLYKNIKKCLAKKVHFDARFSLYRLIFLKDLNLESEKELLDDINSGSRAAMHRLYERYVGYAMAVALRYIPMRDDAEDEKIVL